MKILYVSYYAPPYNCMGSVRMSKIVDSLRELGHEVVIVSGEPTELNKDLPKLERTISVSHINLRNFDQSKTISSFTKNKVLPNSNRLNSNDFVSKMKGLFKKIVTSAVHNIFFPDIELLWSKACKKSFIKLVDEINCFTEGGPDIVYASCLPISSGALGKVFSQHYQVPLVLEFRDKWNKSPYREIPKIRSYFESRYEKKLLSHTDGVVGVTQWLSHLGAKYDTPSETVLTGICLDNLNKNIKKPAVEDFPFLCNKKKTIVYTGMVYPGKRDPSSIIKAFNENCNMIADKYQLVFAGKNFEQFEKINCSESVFFLGQVQRSTALKLQAVADVLLLLSWDNEKEKGVISGKVFEYLEQSKPILHLGCATGEVAQLVNLSGISIASTATTKEVVNAINKLDAFNVDLESLKLISTKNQALKLVKFFNNIQGEKNARSES